MKQSRILDTARSISLILPIFFSIILIFPDWLYVSQADAIEMRSACQNWLALNVAEKGNWAGSNAPIISEVKEIFAENMILAHYYEISPNGFVIVPVLKELPPIMVSSDNCRIDFTESGGILYLIKDVLYDRVNRFKEAFGNLDYSPDYSQLKSEYSFARVWDDYLLDKKSFLERYNSEGISRATVGPLLTTAWHQGFPYNNLCPMGDGGRCVVGCVATAAAQILRFWKWPQAGTGSYSYFWDGDNSCNDEGTPGEALSADFSDEYIWDDDPANLAEICYETGVAFRMDYGRCGSGSYTDLAISAFPTYFKYKSNINRQDRIAYNIDEWFDVIKEEINAGRPMQYRINLHSIVCDGYSENGGLKQYHFNYGWGGSSNAWFTLDNLYCPWDGCSYAIEYLIRNIEPKVIIASADAPFGTIPHEVNFTGDSELDVDSWNWDFGDGFYSSEQSPVHTYNLPGCYDINIEISSGGTLFRSLENDMVIVTADTMVAADVRGDFGSSVAVPIYIRNIIPLNKVVVPIRYSGDLLVRFDSVSTAGCRAEGFIELVNDIGSGFLALELIRNSVDLSPGTGIVANVYFTILSGSASSKTDLFLDDIGSYERMFYGDFADYRPEAVPGSIQLPFICGDADNSRETNILDIICVINYVYKSGPLPESLDAANVNNDSFINILDIIYLINFIYKDGPDPYCD